MKTAIPLFTLIFLAATAFAADLHLAWDAPPAPVAGFKLYISTNELSDATLGTNTLSLDVGTNLTVTLTNLPVGKYWLAASDYDSNGVESTLSNVLQVEVPEPPNNLRTLVLQASFDLTSTNWQDLGFLRLKSP